MLNLSFELALAQRRVSELKRVVGQDKEREQIYRKARNFLEQARHKKRQFDELADEKAWLAAQGRTRDAVQVESKMEQLEGEIFLRCSRVNMTYHHDFWKDLGIEDKERAAAQLPPA